MMITLIWLTVALFVLTLAQGPAIDTDDFSLIHGASQSALIPNVFINTASDDNYQGTMGDMLVLSLMMEY